jgi:hypothetical protein
MMPVCQLRVFTPQLASLPCRPFPDSEWTKPIVGNAGSEPPMRIGSDTIARAGRDGCASRVELAKNLGFRYGQSRVTLDGERLR